MDEISHCREGGLCEKLASQGRMVCAADLRGIAISGRKPGKARLGISHANKEDYAWASLIPGRPFLGQQVADILGLVHASKEPGKNRDRGQWRSDGPGAVRNHLFFEGHRERYLTGGLGSFRALCNFIPDVLAHVDWPELAVAIAPRRGHLAAVTDAAVSLCNLTQCARCIHTRIVELSREAGWNLERLLQL